MHRVALDEARRRRDIALAHGSPETALAVGGIIEMAFAVEQRDAAMAEIEQQAGGRVEGALVVDVEIGIGFGAAGAAMDDEGNAKLAQEARSLILDQRARQ